jgi:hypothetical protein
MNKNTITKWGSMKIVVPSTMSYTTKTGIAKNLSPLTRTGNIARRDKTPAINLITEEQKQKRVDEQKQFLKHHNTLLKNVSEISAMNLKIPPNMLMTQKTNELEQLHISDSNHTRYLKDYLEISKPSINDPQYSVALKSNNKDTINEIIKCTNIYDQMFDEIDNKYSKEHIKDHIDKLNIDIDDVSNYVLNWFDNKTRSGEHSPEYADFCRLVIFPSLVKHTPKKGLTNEDKFILMMCANDIALDARFSYLISDQLFKNKLVKQFIRPKPIGTLQFFRFISSKFSSLHNELLNCHV